MDLQDDLGEDLNSQQILMNDVSLNQIQTKDTSAQSPWQKGIDN
jgi:hypothetical protein